MSGTVKFLSLTLDPKFDHYRVGTFVADPDPTLRFDADPDPTLRFDAVPDPTLLEIPNI